MISTETLVKPRTRQNGFAEKLYDKHLAKYAAESVCDI